jgi:porin
MAIPGLGRIKRRLPAILAVDGYGRQFIRCALLWLVVAISAPALAGGGAAWASVVANSQSSATATTSASSWEIPPPASSPASLPALLIQMTDPGGLRTRLEEEGVQVTFTYYGDLFANPSGGVKQGPGYDGRFGTIIDADLEKLAGWSGMKFHASFHQIHGSEFSANNLENLMTVSGIEAPLSTRLFNLWVEQKLGSDVNLRIGQFTAGQEFLVSQNASLFVNATFGWPVLTAQDLPSGGPSYPEATPGVRLAFTPNDQLTIKAVIFSGDPAGPGADNPVERDPFGLAFRVRDPPLVIAELAYAYKQTKPGSGRENPHQEGMGARTGQPQNLDAVPSGLPGTVKFGVWVHTGRFADQRFDAQGGRLAVSRGPPLQHAGNFGVYAILDQMVWRVPGGASDRGLNFFLRVSAAPSDRNPIDLYADSGLTFKGPLASRPDDVLGLGLAFGRISPRAAAQDRDLVALSGTPMPIRDFEAAIELTYQIQVADGWAVQPNIQYIVHPGANVPNPVDPTGRSPIRDAAVLDMRTMLKF